MRRTVLRIVMVGGMLLLAPVALANSWATATKQANAGDSISQGFGANSIPGDHPRLSWVQGTDSDVGSLFTRYYYANGSYAQQPESVSGAEMVGGDDNFPTQAWRICSQAVKPTRVQVLLGGNDVCNRPRSSSWDAAANLYSVGTWTESLRAGLDQLAACLPPKSVVQVLSVPRVDFLYEAGRSKSLWCSWGVWPMANVCRVVTAEGNAGRRAQIGARIDQYNVALAAEVAAYAQNTNGKNPGGIGFMTDWVGSIAQGKESTSIGTFRFLAQDINGVDCFHPNVDGQSRIACLAWHKGPEGSGNASHCFAR